MKTKPSFPLLSKTIKGLFLAWILSIVVFAFLIYISPDHQVNDSTGLAAMIDILIGTLVFGSLVLTVFARFVLKNKVLTLRRSFGGKVVFVSKLLVLFGILPLFLLVRILKDHKTKVVGKIAQAIFVALLLLPPWGFTYWVIGLTGAQQLGYLAEPVSIVGTGSMYPTWPKGTKGKEPKELAKEIVSSAGFLPYPNGIVFRGKRYFNHKIARGDIVTAQNNEISKITEKTYGTPSGILKRVIALGGDTIELRDGIVYLNDNPLKEQYIAKPRSTFGEDFLKECQKYTVPSDSVFLMGDNRKGSGDSREFGPVKFNEIKSVLTLSKQRGKLDKNWHDATNDLADRAKPRIDRNQFVELLNGKRKENGVVPIKYEPKLDVSAKIRGEYLLKHNTIQQQASFDVISNAMSRAGYWNSYVWEWSLEGYYDADELIEDYLERDPSGAKSVWFDQKFDDIGIAEVQGTLNNCPTQIIVIHAAGYVPPNYRKEVIESWRKVVDNLNSVIPSWEAIRGKGWVNEDELNTLLNLLYRERSIASTILDKMDKNQWLSKDEEASISVYESLAQQSSDLARKLNDQ